ncbi:hypothetical protein X805_31760 [Sphaerotilus natans subsp. natans DSM 6575]|uniref:Uncharacterized protein n=1 Tax=Sphaerotilus natans subsp. natans DSM 6575 TaxID=1286631 RepID=A0A059KID3_9BURK|nr:hypothetical protein X805_31760 [Sphaerotilus natans subsp. natans DSM 6575]
MQQVPGHAPACREWRERANVARRRGASQSVPCRPRPPAFHRSSAC